MDNTVWPGSPTVGNLLPMLRKHGPRKVRLLPCAIARQFWSQLTDERSRHAVEAAEAFADGGADEAALAEACRDAEEVWSRNADDFTAALVATNGKWRKHIKAAALELTATRAAFVASCPDPQSRFFESHFITCGGGPEAEVIGMYSGYSLFEGHLKTQSFLIFDLIGNPYRTVTFDPAWVTPAVSALARSIYEDRRFEDVPILGDALEEAGCDSEGILGHCRVNVPHARGCWLVDRILGKG